MWTMIFLSISPVIFRTCYTYVCVCMCTHILSHTNGNAHTNITSERQFHMGIWELPYSSQGMPNISLNKLSHNYYPVIYNCIQIRSNQISGSVLSNSLRPHESQHTRPPCLSPTPRVHSDSRPSSQWCHPAISSPSPPSPNPSQHQSLFQWVNSLHEVAKVLEFQL